VRVLFAYGCLLGEIVLSSRSKARGVPRTISSGHLSGGVEPLERNKVGFHIEDASANPHKLLVSPQKGNIEALVYFAVKRTDFVVTPGINPLVLADVDTVTLNEYFTPLVKPGAAAMFPNVVVE
jgi:hypothetical protein